MIYTNKNDIPEPIAVAIMNDPYDNEGSDITVTTLIEPIQAVELKRRHSKEIVEDIGDRLWSTYGQLMHGLLERTVKGNTEMALRYLSEQRIFTTLLGWKVSGQFDLFDLEKKTLYDYKFVGSYAVKMALQAGKLEWEIQLNCLRYLLWLDRGILAEKLAIVAMVRDFSERIEKEGIRPVNVIEFPVWELERAADFVLARVLAHQTARALEDKDLPLCTDDERWYRNGKYARCARYCSAKTVCRQFNAG